MSLGDFIRRTAKGRPRAPLALAIGVKRSTLHSWMSGSRCPTLSHLQALGRELGWSDAQLAEAVRLAGSIATPSAAA